MPRSFSIRSRALAGGGAWAASAIASEPSARRELGAEQLDGARAEDGDERVVEGRQQRDALVVGGG